MKRFAERLEDLILPIEYILMLVTFLECSSMYVSQYKSPIDMPFFFYNIAIALLVVDVLIHVIITKAELKAATPMLILIAILDVYGLLFFFVNVFGAGWESWDFIRNFCILLPLFIVLNWYKQQRGMPFDLFYKHSNLVSTFCTGNLVVFLTTIFNGMTVSSDTFYSTWETSNVALNFYNILMVQKKVAWQIADIPLLRNYGIFTEPLLFSIPLITALFTELFLVGKEDRLRITKLIILSVTLVSSQTTMGMMILAAAWGLKLIQVCITKNVKLLAIPVIPAVATVVYFLLQQKKLQSYVVEKSGSIYAHLHHYKEAFDVFKSAPFFGVGYQTESYKGISNTITIVLAEGGIVLGLLCMVPYIILMAKIFRKGKRNLCLWGMGVFAVYIVTLVHYHIYLMLVMAFGYSQLWLLSCQESETSEEPEEIKKIKVTDWVLYLSIFIYALAAFILIKYGRPVWELLYRFIRMHQLSMSQSVLKAFFLSCGITLNLALILNAIARRKGIANAAIIILTDVIYLLSYNLIYSLTDTWFSITYTWNVILEGITLFAIFLLIYGVLWLAYNFVRNAKSPLYYVLATIIIGIFAVIPMAVTSYIDGYQYTEAEHFADLVPVLNSASGKIFSSMRPAIFHSASEKMAYAGTRDDGFDAYKGDATIIYTADDSNNYEKLFEAGYEVTQLSDSLLCYSTDTLVINSMKKLGYHWYKYFQFEQELDGATTLKGSSGKSLKGTIAEINKGSYTLSLKLSINRMGYEKLSENTVIGSSRITYLAPKAKKESKLGAKDIELSYFDEDGNYTLEIPFTIKSYCRGVDYVFEPLGDYDFDIEGVTLKETPEYLTITKTDVFDNILREEYYNIDGSPYLLPSGYASMEQDYDLRGRRYETRYYDEDGNRAVTKDGYSAIRYEYNRQGSVIKREYFDEKDNRTLIADNYSKVEMDYDTQGNVIEYRYYGVNDERVLYKNKYYKTVRGYDEERRCIHEEYYGLDDKPILLEAGYAGIDKIYDKDNNVIEQTYLDINLKPVQISSDYSGVKREYNDKGQVVKEAYFDENDNPIALSGGQAVVVKSYDSRGNVEQEEYYGVDGEPILYNGKYFKIRRVFNA